MSKHGRDEYGYNYRYSRKNQHKSVPLEQAEDTRIESNMSEGEIETRIRRRIAARTKMRNEFFGHLTTYVIVNAICWAIYLGGNFVAFSFINGIPFVGGIPWPIYVTFFWGIGLVSHGFNVYQNSGRVTARRERAIRDEIEMERARLGLDSNYEKPKRQESVRLSDDGELVPLEELTEDESDYVPKAKRDNRY